MKPIAFDYVRAADVEDAVSILEERHAVKILAGGQTLGPMLNLRLAQPELLLDITRIAALAAVREEADAVVIGATVTHAAIEDGRVTDPTRGFLARVARGIGYRAVRTRGTIGGSLAHADPAADWLACLTALGADVVIAGRAGGRRVAVARFVRGALETELGAGELLVAVRVPKFSRAARFGYHKICRKVGEFADAIGVAVDDPERGVFRLVASTAAGAPLLLESATPWNISEVAPRLRAAGFVGDDYDHTLATAALRRALAEAAAT